MMRVSCISLWVADKLITMTITLSGAVGYSFPAKKYVLYDVFYRIQHLISLRYFDIVVDGV